jgi:hypothetical protein
MTLSDARRRLSATHQLALRCVAEGDDDLVAAERLGVPLAMLPVVVADAGAALHRVLTDAADHLGEMGRGVPVATGAASGLVRGTNPQRKEQPCATHLRTREAPPG